MKNQAKLPRTVGLRTITELTSELTKAGLDPSRIQERAERLAKIAGAKRKRQREEEEAEMDVDEDKAAEDEDEWMDVDGEERPTPSKRAKANSGAVITKGKLPRTDRRLGGMRDEAVRYFFGGDGRVLTCRVLLTASIESHQAAGSQSQKPQYAGQGRRERPCHQDQNGGEIHF